MDDVRVTDEVTIPASEIMFRFSRSGGPGGQNVNTRATRVELIFDVVDTKAFGPHRERVLQRIGKRLDSEGRLRIVAADERTQERNRARALDRFRDVLAWALRPEPKARRATRPSRASVERRLADKAARSRVKRDRAAKRYDD